VVDLSSERYAFVIPTNVAPAIQSEIMREMKKIRREFRIELRVKVRTCSFNLTNKKVN